MHLVLEGMVVGAVLVECTETLKLTALGWVLMKFVIVGMGNLALHCNVAAWAACYFEVGHGYHIDIHMAVGVSVVLGRPFEKTFDSERCVEVDSLGLLGIETELNDMQQEYMVDN